jgi:hypothetical protein
MADAASEFLAAARAFRSALAGRDPADPLSARRVRNAVARLYLAAAFLPSRSSAEPAEPVAPLGVDESLALIDDALRDAVARLEADRPGAVWRARRDFERRWGGHAVDVLRPLHRIATSDLR